MQVHVVLVRTDYARNVGAAARAMANMGADRLILIDPRCELDENAKQMAAGAQGHLARAQIYPNWEDFYAAEGQGIRLGMTRRSGKKRKTLSLPQAFEELSPDSKALGHLYLVFGPEASGLDASDLAYMNFSCHLPIQGEFESMNLAQAVLLALFLARQRFPLSDRPTEDVAASVAPRPFEFPDAILKDWLKSIGFDISARKASAYLTVRRLLLQNQPTRHEAQVLEAVLQQTVRKLKRDPSTQACAETAD